MGLPRHRWYALKEGFSESSGARHAVGANPQKRRPVEILDPFAGSGTTLVSAGRLGQKATGIEVNPFLAFAAQAKSSTVRGKETRLRERVQAVLASTRYERASSLEGQSTFTETAGKEKWLFNHSVLRGVHGDGSGAVNGTTDGSLSSGVDSFAHGLLQRKT